MTDYKELEWLISEADVLIKHDVKPSTPGFQAWFLRAERYLVKRFGINSLEYKKLKETEFMPNTHVTDSYIVKKCKSGLVATKLIFQAYLEELKEETKEKQVVKKVEKAKSFSKIFIVHGHDEALKQSVARLIEKQNIEAVILSEKANKGKTIIEKLEEHSDVGCAICLFTPDDTGKANKETDYKARARQNVVLEAGFFMGKLGREYVVYLASSELEMPSDLQGVVYTSTSNWEFSLLKELKDMGYNIDFNKLM